MCYPMLEHLALQQHSLKETASGQGQDGLGWKQPGLMEGVHVHGRGVE